MSALRAPAASPDQAQDLLVCKFHEFGCPAAWLTPEALEEHMREDATAHLELVHRALQVERSLKEHHKEAMTNAQSRCRKLEKEIIQCKAENAKLDQALSTAQHQLTKLNRLAPDDIRIRNIIGSFLHGDNETVRGFTPLLPGTVGSGTQVPAVRDRAILGVSLCDTLRQQQETIRDLQATVSKLETQLQTREQDLVRAALRSRSFSSEEGAPKPRARPVGPVVFPRNSLSAPPRPFRFNVLDMGKTHQEAIDREYEEMMGELYTLMDGHEDYITSEASSPPAPVQSQVPPGPGPRPLPRHLSYLCPYSLYRKATSLIRKRPKAPVGEQAAE